MHPILFKIGSLPINSYGLMLAISFLLGVKLASKRGLKLVFTGDTAITDELIEFSRDADALIHEATFADDEADKAEKFGHSTSRQAAKIAKEAGVSKLFLVHTSPRYKDNVKILLEQAKEEFDDVVIPDDFDEYKITAGNRK